MNQLVAEFVSAARGFPASALVWLVAVLAFEAHAVCSKGTVFWRPSHEFFIISTFFRSFLISCTTVGYFASMAAGGLLKESRGALAACSASTGLCAFPYRGTLWGGCASEQGKTT